MSEDKTFPRTHNGLCCWFLDKADGQYKCAIKGCKRTMKEKNPDD